MPLTGVGGPALYHVPLPLVVAATLTLLPASFRPSFYCRPSVVIRVRRRRHPVRRADGPSFIASHLESCPEESA